MTDLAFSQLVDVEQIRRLLESHYKVTGTPSAILDTEENILVAVGWADICTRFHRAHPGTRTRCLESDARIKANVRELKGEYLEYRCGNGLWDVAMPVIIAGEHLATLFTGQFFYDDDRRDNEFFLAQAEEFGFDRDDYLEALGRVPVLSREHVRNIMDYYRGLVEVMAELGMRNLELTREIAGRKKAEAELQRSRDYLDKIINTIPDPIFVKDREHRLVLANDAECRLIGRRREEIIGKTDYDFFPQEQVDVFREKDELVFGTELENLNEEEITGPDGYKRTIVTKKSLYVDNDGDKYVVGTIREITERKIMEEALLNSEMILRKVFESTPDLLLVIGRDFRILKSNWHGGYEYVDGTVRDGFPHCYEVFYPGRTATCKDCPAMEVFRTGRPVITERFSPKTNRQLEVRSYPVFDEAGNVAMVAEHVRDVTEQKKAQQSLVDSEKRYRSLFEAMTEGFALHEAVYDEDGKPVDYRFVDVNPAFEKRIGLSRQRLIGKTVRGLMPDMGRELIDIYGEVAASGEPGHFEKYSEELDRYFEVNTYCPKPGQFAAIFSDVTERRRLHEEMAKGQKLESLGILAGGIAHDFNNILAGILGNLSIVRMLLPPDQKAGERIAACEKAVRQATGLTRQLLTFSRGGDPVKKVLDLRRVLNDAASFALHGSNITARLEIAYDLWLIDADEGQITQVISNLLINADQAMPNGGMVLIKACNMTLGKEEVTSLEPGRYVRFSVVDNGKGIPPKHLGKIFDPYFTTKETGTGLGLTALYSIVRKHGGQVLVSSQVGTGTAFEIYLPAGPGYGEAEPVKPAPSAEVRGGQVYVMDDEEMIREIAEELFSLLGCKVETFPDGEQLIERYRAALEAGSPPDAVVMDLTIPGKMGGLEAASLILELDPEALLIVASGYSNDPVMANHRNYGFADVLLKPFRIEDLSAILKRHSDKRRRTN